MKSKILGSLLIASLAVISLFPFIKKDFYERNQRINQIYSYVEKSDGNSGVSIQDKKGLRNKFIETDPRHIYSQIPTGRMSIYRGNSGLSIDENSDVRKVLQQASSSELERVLGAYKNSN